MSNPIIIGLTGYAGAGKDTVADALVTHAGFTKIAFADALRSEVAAAFQLGDQYGILSDRAGKEHAHRLLAFSRCVNYQFVARMAHIEAEHDDPDSDYAEWLNGPRSPRQVMQLWGTEYRRAQSPNYWSTQVAIKIAAGIAHGIEHWVITDCRFDNEAQAIRRLGGEIWQVQRPGHKTPEGGHASQTDGMRFAPERVLINGMDVPALIRTTLRTLQARHGGAVINLS